MNISRADHLVEIDECSLDQPPLPRSPTSPRSPKTSLNQRTQRFLANISKIRLPQLFSRQSATRNNSNNSRVLADLHHPVSPVRRPQSMIFDHSTDPISNIDQYMHDSTILMALRDTETQLLESEKHRSRLELKIESLENEVSHLQRENDEFLCRERALLSQIQELERRIQLKDAEIHELGLNARIKEMEQFSEIATLSQKLSNIETEKQELKIQKIIDCQNRIMEQTLPYTTSVENIYDNEDGLFNASLFDEILKEQSQSLDNGEVYKKLSIQKNDEEDNLPDSLLLSEQDSMQL